MSEFDRTIEPKGSFQCGSGQAADATPEDLDGIRDVEAYKGILIRNTNGTAVNLLIGYVNVPPLYELPQATEVFLEIKDVANIRVSGDGAACDYTYLAY